MNLRTILRLNSAAMNVARTRLNVTAANMANAETTRTPEGGPYKRRMVIVEAQPLKDDQGFAVGRHHGMSLREPTALNIAKDEAAARLEYDPSHPDANADGYVSKPNIDVVTEMVNMMAATRAYSAATNATKSVKAMAQAALNIVT
ncbi:MAG: flagellar basal body rod protein FlgC [Myxococcota bacterium]|nr:flagellar basal body rod protein FlgC [Myxococcota bacterium]